jgi:hypothetical protein
MGYGVSGKGRELVLAMDAETLCEGSESRRQGRRIKGVHHARR